MICESKPNTLLEFVAKTGVGKTGSKHLTREEAHAAMTAALRGEFDPVTFGSFFMAMRFVGENAEELAGFLDAMYAAQRDAEAQAFGTAAIAAPAGLIGFSGAYDGKSRTLNSSLAAGLLVSSAGVPVIFHGTRGVPTKFGMTISHLLEALKIPVRLPLPRVLDHLNLAGVAYADQAELNPALHILLPFRTQIGKRTIINTMEALSNPFGAQLHVGGFFHDPYAHLVCQALMAEGMPFTRAMLVKGIEGSDELRPGGVFYAEMQNANYQTVPVDTDALGLPIHISELTAKAATVDEQTQLSIAALNELLDDPARESAYKNIVVLNAGLRLVVAGKVPSIAEGIAVAKELLLQGAAGEKLRQWQSAAH